MSYKETAMLQPNVCHLMSSHKMAKVEVCLAASPGKQPGQGKGHWLCPAFTGPRLSGVHGLERQGCREWRVGLTNVTLC